MRIQSATTTIVLAAIAVVFLAMGTPGRLHAQEPEAAADSVAVDDKPTDLMRAQEMLATMSAGIDSLLILEPRFKKAEDELFDLLRVQALRHIARVDEAQRKLLKLLPDLDAADPDVIDLKEKTAARIVTKFNLYERALAWWSREIDDLRGRRSETAAAELEDLERQIKEARQRLDSLLDALAETLAAGDAMELDTAAAWESFDRTINNRAENLIGRLQIAVNARDNLKKKLERSQGAGSPEAEVALERNVLKLADERVEGLATSFEHTVDLLGTRGFETTPYRQFIIRTTGEISERVLDPRILLGLTKDFLKDAGRWFKDRGPTILVKILIIIASVLVFRVVFRLAWWLMRLVGLIKLTRLMVQLGNSMLNPLATIFGLFMGLWLIGANPTTLLTGAGVAGVIIGFALQDSLSNLAAGFFILATRPFDVDDVIRTGDVVGTVKAMWIANTTVVTFDGRRLLIPNRKIWSDNIENRSVEPLRRVDIMVRVGFDEDIDRTIAILHDLVRGEGRVLDSPAPAIFVSEWADSWVDIAVRPWTVNADWWPLLTDLPRLAVLRFAAEGIEIPYPRRELRGRPDGPQQDGDARAIRE